MDKKNNKEITTKNNNDTLQINNDYYSLDISNLKAREINIFKTILANLVNQKNNEISISFDNLLKIADVGFKNSLLEKTQFFEQTIKQFFSLNMRTDDGNIIERIALFEKAKVNREKQEITFKIGTSFEYLLNNFDLGNYSKIVLDISNKLKTIFAKRLLDWLFKYRDKGLWIVALNDLKLTLEWPDKFVNYKIMERVINQSIKDIKKAIVEAKKETLFKDLQVSKITNSHSRKIEKLIFTFLPITDADIDELKQPQLIKTSTQERQEIEKTLEVKAKEIKKQSKAKIKLSKADKNMLKNMDDPIAKIIKKSKQKGKN